jgi:glycosyltransferase involved in cell wall biosynthesis
MSVKTSDHVQAGNSVPDTTIVIPVYNEEGLLSTAIVDLLNGLQTVDFTYEIIVSENGSSDATKEIALGLERKHQHVRVLIGEEPNYGKALKRGIMEAQGTYVLCDEIDICDVDFHQRAMDILRSDQADISSGRYKGHQYVTQGATRLSGYRHPRTESISSRSITRNSEALHSRQGSVCK